LEVIKMTDREMKLAITNAKNVDIRTLMGDCPDCSKTLNYNKRRNTAKCFKCGKSFDSIDLVVAMEGIKFLEAVTQLTGVDYKPTFKPPTKQEELEAKQARLTSLNNNIYYATTSQGKEIPRINQHDAVLELLSRRGIQIHISDLKALERTTGLYMYTSRQAGKVTGLLVVQKYTNGNLHFGFTKPINGATPNCFVTNAPTRLMANDSKVLVVVEGIYDALTLYSMGYNTISLNGVANAEKAVQTYLSRGYDIQLLLDNDEAGINATKKLMDTYILEQHPMFYKLQEYKVKDVNDYHRLEVDYLEPNALEKIEIIKLEEV
jgi:DNA primase